ncbi:MAG: PHB depolymerase family esterase [Bacteroidales bacterium]|nr:PHB depolymerase family esterase [Bacteroidales bacterium]MDP2234903.1 PHB depolymerase family esterase [Bacteroidales bacterium]
MKKLLFILSAFLLFAALLPKVSTGQTTHSFMHNGINRTFILFVPSTHQPGIEAPLLLALHGFTQNGQTIMQFSNFNTLAEENGFIVVYPYGVSASWNVGVGGGSGADDVGFLLALTDTIDAWHGIDQNRVYSTGFSNGGFMSFRLACEASYRIAAIASVAGTMTSSTYDNCLPERAVPVLHIHGTSDFIVAYNGTSGFKSVMDGMNYWAGFNECPPEPEIINLPDIVQEGSTVQQFTWFPCNENTEVKHLKVNGGGHTWPGYDGFMGIGNVNMDISASAEIWNFVSRFSIASPTGVTNFSEDKLPQILPNPVSGEILTIKLSEAAEKLNMIVFSLDGRQIINEKYTFTSKEILLNISQLDEGLYFLRLNFPFKSVDLKFIRLK